MLNNTITVNYNATAYTLARVKESNYTSEFFYRSATLDLTLQIGHTIPKNGASGESHLVTLWAHKYDAEGVETDRERAFERVVTEVGKQDSTTVGYLDAALRDFMGTNGADIFDRAS